ncbi:MAG: diguanylate cyclase (GGDEF)-like protein [Glaciecola sp.]
MSGELILIVDDDDDIRMFLEVTLTLAGFEVTQATDGEQGVQRAIEDSPALVLMDVMMPKMDGITAVRRLRLDGRTSHLPIIVLTAKAQGDDKVSGLAAGADDYITKPFDPDELVARVQSTLRRASEMRTVSPLTGLPGNTRIEQELQRRVESDMQFALLYADLNNFKAYNDHYGFIKGDEVIKMNARVVVDAVSVHGDPDSFIGHIGGDDFVIICNLDQAEAIAQGICTGFDEQSGHHYSEEDRERGFIEGIDRRGQPQKYPVMTISVGVTPLDGPNFEHPSQPVEFATEMKSYAKKNSDGTKSNYAVDRRNVDDDVASAPSAS